MGLVACHCTRYSYVRSPTSSQCPLVLLVTISRTYFYNALSDLELCFTTLLCSSLSQSQKRIWRRSIFLYHFFFTLSLSLPSCSFSFCTILRLYSFVPLFFTSKVHGISLNYSFLKFKNLLRCYVQNFAI